MTLDSSLFLGFFLNRVVFFLLFFFSSFLIFSPSFPLSFPKIFLPKKDGTKKMKLSSFSLCFKALKDYLFFRFFSQKKILKNYRKRKENEKQKTKEKKRKKEEKRVANNTNSCSLFVLHPSISLQTIFF